MFVAAQFHATPWLLPPQTPPPPSLTHPSITPLQLTTGHQTPPGHPSSPAPATATTEASTLHRYFQPSPITWLFIYAKLKGDVHSAFHYLFRILFVFVSMFLIAVCHCFEACRLHSNELPLWVKLYCIILYYDRTFQYHGRSFWVFGLTLCRLISGPK